MWNCIVRRLRTRVLRKGFQLYRPGLILLPKPDGASRPIHRFSDDDRILFRAVYQVISQILESHITREVAYCSLRSNPIRPFGTIPHAQLELSKARREQKRFLIKFDISSFYGSVSRSLLREKLDAIFSDPDAADVIASLIDVPLPDIEDEIPADMIRLLNGLPQGASTSPQLASFYLAEFDNLLSEKAVICIRYVDDICVVAESYIDALEINAWVERKLADLGLQVSAARGKSGIIKPNKDCEFLGARITPTGRLRPKKKSLKELISRLERVAKNLGVDRDVVCSEDFADVLSVWISSRRHYHFTMVDISFFKLAIFNVVVHHGASNDRAKKISNFAIRSLGKQANFPNASRAFQEFMSNASARTRSL